MFSKLNKYIQNKCLHLYIWYQVNFVFKLEELNKYLRKKVR